MFRYPDKPSSQLARAGLADLPKLYIAELKLDGWRCVIERTIAGLTFTSRHNKPIPISDALADELLWVADLAKLPEGTLLDAEWLARRPAARHESLWIFDIMQFGEAPFWGRSTQERLKLLRCIVPGEIVAPTAGGDYADFFDAMQDRGDAEGIVLKRRDARYIGSFRGSALNPGWLKCKWRGGEDGRTAIGRELATA